MAKPIGRKNYGSIGHLPNSRMGPSDSHVHEGQGRICTEKARDRHDRIIVTEKLDGSNVGIAKRDGVVLALGRAGYLADSSPFEMHHRFADWVAAHSTFWGEVLVDGERIIGEWLAQAHGTVYGALPKSGPFAAFDLMRGPDRAPHDEFIDRCQARGIEHVRVLHDGGPITVGQAMILHGPGSYGADEPEGVVYRVERRGEFDFMAKWVRPNKIDGKHLPGLQTSTRDEPLWLWTA